jgi:hypothetical protein
MESRRQIEQPEHRKSATAVDQFGHGEILKLLAGFEVALSTASRALLPQPPELVASASPGAVRSRISIDPPPLSADQILDSIPLDTLPQVGEITGGTLPMVAARGSSVCAGIRPTAGLRRGRTIMSMYRGLASNFITPA